MLPVMGPTVALSVTLSFLCHLRLCSLVFSLRGSLRSGNNGCPCFTPASCRSPTIALTSLGRHTESAGGIEFWLSPLLIGLPERGCCPVTGVASSPECNLIWLLHAHSFSGFITAWWDPTLVFTQPCPVALDLSVGHCRAGVTGCPTLVKLSGWSVVHFHSV